MRVLLDECIDRRLAREIHGYEVRTVAEMGWANTLDGPLLQRAQGAFDIFVTVDQNLPHQQPLHRFSITVVILRAKSNRLADLKLLVPSLLRALPSVQPGAATFIEP